MIVRCDRGAVDGVDGSTGRPAEREGHSVSTSSDPAASAETTTVLSEDEVSAGPRARRLGRPRGPVRVPLTIRILASHNERLSSEVDLQGLSPQYLVEQALTEYFARLDRQRSRAGKPTD